MAPNGTPARPPIVLVAIEQEWAARSLDSILAPNGYAVLRAHTGRQALELARSTQPDAVIIDVSIRDIDGLEVCRLLAADLPSGRTTPIIVTAADAGRAQRLEALGAGAWLFCPQPLDGETFLLQLRTFIEAKREANRLREQHLLDEATGLYSIHGLARRAREIGAEALRREIPLACLAVAPARFGPTLEPTPSVSTDVTAYLGGVIRQCGRASDAMGRLGLSEFAIIAPSTDSQGAVRLVGRLRDALDDRPPPAGASRGIEILAGYHAVSNFAESPIDAIEMLLRATTALRSLRGERDGPTIKAYDELTPAIG